MELKKVIPLFIFFILSIQHYVKAALFLQLKETTTESLLLSVQYILGPYCTEGGQHINSAGKEWISPHSAFLGYESLSVIGHGLITATVGFLVALQFALASDFASDLMESLVMESSVTTFHSHTF